MIAFLTTGFILRTRSQCFHWFGVVRRTNRSLSFAGKIEKTDWNINALEKKIEENKFGRGMASSAAKVPKWNRQQFDDKVYMRCLVDSCAISR